ncbi:MAG: glutaredoxin domain-containing protein, partial [Pseudomonadota bacterium]
VAQILGYLQVEYKDVNVLASDDMRQGIKDYSDWPTVPQLYVKGEFVGGCDIITEMTLSGELDTAFESAGVTFSKEAADAIRNHNSEQA